MLKNIYNQKVTILNKLKRSDNQSNLDVWYKTIVDDAAWYRQSDRTVTNNNVSIGSYIVCLLPYHQEYLPYSEWKDVVNQSEHFTMSPGDYIVLGDVTEEITASNVVSVISQYEPNVCTVKHCTELYNRFGARIQLRVEGT